MLRVVIVDDEPPARARLRRLLKAHDAVEIAAECGDGAAAVQAIESAQPDLVLLDVQMPELDGFDVLRALDMPRLPAVIFVTAFDSYALRAFEVHALDYVVKPVDAARFDRALSHARQRISEQRSAGEGLTNLIRELARDRTHLKRIPVRSEGRVKVIDLADVDWMSAADNYVTLHVGGQEYLLRDTLSALEQRLDAGDFVRVHRSTIVRVDRIAELLPDLHGDYRIRLKNGSEVALSRTYRPRLEERFGRPL
ncbi:MAG TPA: LytTR family transcriptional regulator DNA-binding domain-containing protein [Vicinamibacterales bacterium]